MANDNNISLEIELLKKAMDLSADSSLIDVVNELIDIHFKTHKDCDYKLREKELVSFSHAPLATQGVVRKDYSIPPLITVTKTVITDITD